jgi:hypothetical protein
MRSETQYKAVLHGRTLGRPCCSAPRSGSQYEEFVTSLFNAYRACFVQDSTATVRRYGVLLAGFECRACRSVSKLAILMRGSPNGACLTGPGSASTQQPACIPILRRVHWGVREDVRSWASVSNARQPLRHVDRCLRLTKPNSKRKLYPGS